MIARRVFATPQVRRGSTLPVVVALLVVLIGMVAFAVDVGYIAVKRTDLQRTADAATLAGAALLGTQPGKAVDYAAVRAEVKKFASLNESLTIPDADIEFGLSTTSSAFTTTLLGNQPNALRVTLRRDKTANQPLNLFFAPVLGQRSTDVRARAVAVVPTGYGVGPGPDLLPYVIHTDYFHSAVGSMQSGVSAADITDIYTTHSDGTVTSGGDGVKEIVLYGSSGGGKSAPGNFGSVDIGSDSNGTPELIRQILYGPTAADFAHKDFSSKVTNGVLYAPNSFGGDTGLSTAVKDAFTSIIGQKRIVPLYSKVTGNGNNAVYTITEFAGVTIVAVDMTGNPKKVVAQPTGFFSTQVNSNAPPSATTAKVSGVYPPLRVIIP